MEPPASCVTSQSTSPSPIRRGESASLTGSGCSCAETGSSLPNEGWLRTKLAEGKGGWGKARNLKGSSQKAPRTPGPCFPHFPSGRAPKTGSRPQEGGRHRGGGEGQVRQRGVRAEEEPAAGQRQEGLAGPCLVRRERGRLSGPSSHQVPLRDLNALWSAKQGSQLAPRGALFQTLRLAPAGRARASQGGTGVPHAPPATAEALKPVPSLLLQPVPPLP